MNNSQPLGGHERRSHLAASRSVLRQNVIALGLSVSNSHCAALALSSGLAASVGTIQSPAVNHSRSGFLIDGARYGLRTRAWRGIGVMLGGDQTCPHPSHWNESTWWTVLVNSNQ